MNQDIYEKLCAPFPFEEVEAKIQVNAKDKPVGMAVFYLNSRAIQKRLDEVVGPLHWQNHYSPWKDNAQLCGISIYDKERGEWITKHDGAENSDIEAIKGGLTDAFKRSAVLWGIGRYLYEIDGVWVEVEQRGKSSIIKENQQGKLKAAYDATVKKIFAPAANSQTSGRTAAVANKPANVLQAPPPSPQNANAPAPASAPATTPTAPQVTSAQAPAATSPPLFDFKVHSMKPSGNKGSQLLELLNRKGEIIAAYIKANNQGIAVGSHLRNVQIEEKSNSFTKYNILANYELAA